MSHEQKRNSVLLASALMASLAAGAAQADVYDTFTTTGTIDSGTDALGIFGAAGADLTGDTYTMVMGFDKVGATINDVGPPAGPPVQETLNAASGYLTVTVGTQTYSMTASASAADSEIRLAVTNGFLLNPPSPDSIFGDVEETDDTGTHFFGIQELSSSTNDFVPSADINQYINYQVQVDDFPSFSFGVCNVGNVCTLFQDDMTGITLNSPLGVPEPSSLSLAAAALGGVIAFVRRRRRALSR